MPDDDRPDREADAERLKTFRIVAWSASPVMIPGSAIGRMMRNEIVSRPKNLVARDGERSKRAEDKRNGRRAERGLDRQLQSVADVGVVPRDTRTTLSCSSRSATSARCSLLNA